MFTCYTCQTAAFYNSTLTSVHCSTSRNLFQNGTNDMSKILMYSIWRISVFVRKFGHFKCRIMIYNQILSSNLVKYIPSSTACGFGLVNPARYGRTHCHPPSNVYLQNLETLYPIGIQHVCMIDDWRLQQVGHYIVSNQSFVMSTLVTSLHPSFTLCMFALLPLFPSILLVDDVDVHPPSFNSIHCWYWTW